MHYATGRFVQGVKPRASRVRIAPHIRSICSEIVCSALTSSQRSSELEERVFRSSEPDERDSPEKSSALHPHKFQLSESRDVT